MEALKTYLDKLLHFTDNEMEVFTALFSQEELKKNDYFAKDGEFSRKIAFITAGVMRAFFRDPSGNEYNKTFFTPFNFVAAYSSITSKQKNLINIQCLTDCTIQVADHGRITSLYNEYPKFERLARIFAEYKFAIKEKREVELVTLEAKERYEIFRREYPDLEQIINQYHIASYLGITPTQLSRIRAKSKSLHM